MSANIRRLALVSACLALGACKFPGLGGHAKAPTGQVVATVDGEEITFRELQMEMGSLNVKDPKQRKALEQAALQAIVNRKVMAKAAEKDGLDKTPDYAMQKKKADDLLLAQTMQAKFASSVPPPTSDQAKQFVATHPEMFQDRKIFDLDQVQIQGPVSQDKLDGLKPIKTMEALETYLTSNNLVFRRGSAELDSLVLDPRLTQAITQLPADDMFVIPAQNVVTVNHIVRTRTQPVGGDEAVKLATTILTNQQRQVAVNRQMGLIIGAAASKISYNPAYQPPARPAGRAPGSVAPVGPSSAPPAAKG